MTRMSKHDAFADSEIYDGDLDEVWDGPAFLVPRHQDGVQDDVILAGDFDDEIEANQ